MCTFNYRFMPAVRLAKDLIAEGKHRHGLPDAGELPADGRPRPGAAARPVLVFGLAAFRRLARDRQPRHRPVPLSRRRDQQRFRPGSDLQRRAGRSRRAGDPNVVADEGTAAVLEFANGALGVMESSVVATGRKNFLSWEINGSKGSLKWDMEHPNSLLACLEQQGGCEAPGLQRDLRDRTGSSLCRPLVAARAQSRLGTFAHHREIPFPRRGGPWPAAEPVQRHFEDGYRVAVIIAAMRESSRSGRRIELDSR